MSRPWISIGHETTIFGKDRDKTFSLTLALSGKTEDAYQKKGNQ